jgi:hypothetical protein
LNIFEKITLFTKRNNFSTLSKHYSFLLASIFVKQYCYPLSNGLSFTTDIEFFEEYRMLECFDKGKQLFSIENQILFFN